MVTHSPKETMAMASEMAKKAQKGDIYCLFGDLGTGKTIFVKGFAKGLGIAEKAIKSPTFTFIREYRGCGGKFYHCDLYRINEVDELLATEFQEIFDKKDGIVIIEWADRIIEFLPEKRVDVKLKYLGENKREIEVFERI